MQQEGVLLQHHELPSGVARRVQERVEPLEIARTEITDHQPVGGRDRLMHALADLLFGGSGAAGRGLGALANQQRQVEGPQLLGELSGEVSGMTVHANVT